MGEKLASLWLVPRGSSKTEAAKSRPRPRPRQEGSRLRPRPRQWKLRLEAASRGGSVSRHHITEPKCVQSLGCILYCNSIYKSDVTVTKLWNKPGISLAFARHSLWTDIRVSSINQRSQWSTNHTMLQFRPYRTAEYEHQAANSSVNNNLLVHPVQRNKFSTDF